MEQTLKFILDKVTQLTNRFNSLTQNSKKIHELQNAANDIDKFIAVSDGTNTFKVLYKPSEVSKNEFDNIANLELSNIQNTSILQIKKSDGNIISSLDLAFLNGNNVSLNIESSTKKLQLLDFQGDAISSLSIDELITKSKTSVVHTLTSADVAQATITINLLHIVDVNEFYDLHINGVFINDDDYIVDQNKIIIAKSNIAYEVSAGMKLTFRYRY